MLGGYEMQLAELMIVQTLFTGAIAFGGIIRVPLDFPTIQEAINAAYPSETIIVAPGTYNERINLLGKAITLRSSDGPDVTILDGQGLGQGSSMVTFSSGEGPDTVLQGFKITNGIGGVSGRVSLGGGVTIYYSSPTILDCSIESNSGAGGGLVVYEGNPVLSDCIFGNNSGNAMNIYSGDVQLTDCIFTNNNASGILAQGGRCVVNRCSFIGNSWNGGIRASDGILTVTNSLFSGNSGGGMYTTAFNNGVLIDGCDFVDNSGGGLGIFSGLVRNSRFIRNSTTESGGGILASRNAIVADCIFEQNTAAFQGGGMWLESDSTEVERCSFFGNSAQLGGGMAIRNSPTVRNCVFVGNRATASGGALYTTEYGSAYIVGCTLSGNTAGNPNTGGLYGQGQVTNSIFWGNLPGEISRGAYSLLISFSDLHGGFPLGATNGGGNIYNNPKFARPPNPGLDGVWGSDDDDYGDLRLLADSPCIDAGVISGNGSDLDGNPRVVGDGVDMGAFEYQGEPQVDGPDFDNDGIPDIRDDDIDDDGLLNALDDCDYTPRGIPVDAGGRPVADLNHDCTVDLFDFGIFQESMIGP